MTELEKTKLWKGFAIGLITGHIIYRIFIN
jgi:hypothetical protein